ncbi:MAG: ATP-binding protein, partial [Bacillota bacterium]|nr:ATP-binding protein [Bacillota bacterium]
RRKIFFYYIILIVIGISITGFFISELAQHFYRQEVENKLKNTANLIQYQISDQLSLGEAIDFNKAAQKYSSLMNTPLQSSSEALRKNTRITFIDFNGRVLGESEADYKSMENHLSRKEVIAAIKGQTGIDIRHSKTLNVDFLYVAVPIESNQIVVRVSTPLFQIDNINQIIWYYTAIGIIAGLLLTILLAYKFSSSITKPIQELIAVSKHISSGNYSKRVEIKTKDEFGQLAATFNDMSLKLEKTISELLDKNIKVDSIINSMTSGIVAVDEKFHVILINSIACELFDIEYGPGIIGINLRELIRNNQINSFLKDTIEKNIPSINEINVGSPDSKILRVHTNPIKSKDSNTLNSGGIAAIMDITNIKKLELIRTEFVSNVTHELKTPLTSIRGFIETLRSGAMNDPVVAEKFLEIIDIEAERLYTLINDILQLSEIETKQKDVNIGAYNLKQIVEEIISILQGAAERKNIKLINEVDEKVKVIVNRDRIKQMLINLIDNGIKYNVENGSVTIKGIQSAGKVVIYVQDTGIGISPEHLPRIFERFYRVDKGRSRNMGGTGLGLSIVKHIVNLYNGDIKINSKPGKGTEFIIQLPS